MNASTAAAGSTRAEAVMSEAEALIGQGRRLDAIDLLEQANRTASDPAVEVRLAALRHEAFLELPEASEHDTWPVQVRDLDRSGPPRIPQLAPADLAAHEVRSAILAHGSVHVPGLLSGAQVQRFVDGIEHVLALRDGSRENPLKGHSSWLSSLKLPREQALSLARPWIAGDGGILACDSPRVLEMLLSTYEDVGLRSLITDYLGERPVLSANKATLRRARLEGKTDWHQDGAFIGTGIRALNVWVALTDCGVDAPGMDIVPRRFEAVQETGTGGAIFDWAVGPETVDRLSVDAPVVRPHYQAGDVMLFDEMLLHRTALDPSMTKPRHAIESWFFAKTGYPTGQVPLVW